MKKNLFKRGFTLIELLVVIAIIGILASVVLASLNSARDKGADAAIKSNLNNMRAQAELFYDDNSNTYGSATFALAACPTTIQANTVFATTTVNALNNVVDQVGNASLTRCYSDSDSWVMASELKTGGTAGDSTPDSYCVDNTGQAVVYTYATGETIANAVSTDRCTP